MARSLTEQAGADGFVSKGGDFRHRVIRALQKLFGAGGAPGNELDDWLCAEQQLKQERAGSNTEATQ